MAHAILSRVAGLSYAMTVASGCFLTHGSDGAGIGAGGTHGGSAGASRLKRLAAADAGVSIDSGWSSGHTDAAEVPGSSRADVARDRVLDAGVTLPAVDAANTEQWVGLMRGFVGYVNGSDPVYSGAPRDESCAIVLTRDGSGGALSGSIAFGDASAAPRVDVLPAASSSDGPAAPFWHYANYGVVAGFAYSLLDVERGDQRLRFGISARQLWRSWCCHGGSFECPANVPAPRDMCDGSCSSSAKCSGPLPATVAFDLSIDGSTMEGVMVREEIGTPPFVPELRLRRQP